MKTRFIVPAAAALGVLVLMVIWLIRDETSRSTVAEARDPSSDRFGEPTGSRPRELQSADAVGARLDAVETVPSLPLAARDDPAHAQALRRNVAQVQSIKPGPGAGRVLQAVMNCVADILHAEGRGAPLEEGSTFSPETINGPDHRAIVRHAWDGAWLYTAERERFPLLFELIEAYRSGADLTEEQCAEARRLAEEADAAYLAMNPSRSDSTGSASRNLTKE